MKSTHFKKYDELSLKCGDDQHVRDIKSNLTFLTFWPNINNEFFQENFLKNLERKEQIIYKAEQFSKSLFFSFS